jgi:hypothetical protein
MQGWTRLASWPVSRWLTVRRTSRRCQPSTASLALTSPRRPAPASHHLGGPGRGSYYLGETPVLGSVYTPTVQMLVGRYSSVYPASSRTLSLDVSAAPQAGPGGFLGIVPGDGVVMGGSL